MRIGLLLPHSGPTALWRNGAEACAELAAREQPSRRPVELIRKDCGESPGTAAAAAVALRDEHSVDVIVGMQPSHQRNAIVRTLGGEIAYIYTPQYEGGWCGPGTVPLGVADREAMSPSIAWMADRRRVSRWFFAGNDYLWPRAAHGAAVASVQDAGGEMVGSSLIPFGETDFDIVFSRIERSRADAVIVVLLGEESVRFHRAFAAAGLSRRIARFCLGCDETLLWALEGSQAEGLFTCQPFFVETHDPPREAMLRGYASRFGGARPPVTAMTAGLYDGVRLALALGRISGAANRGSISRYVNSGYERRMAYAELGLAAMSDGRPRLRIGEADGGIFRSEALV